MTHSIFRIKTWRWRQDGPTQLYSHNKLHGRQTAVQLVEALCYKSEGRGFDSRWCHWNFSLTESARPHCGPGVDSLLEKRVSGIFPGVKGGRCIGLTTLPPSCANCLEIWEPQGLSWPVVGLLYLYQTTRCHVSEDQSQSILMTKQVSIFFWGGVVGTS